MAKLIFGCGYLGARVAARWRTLGHEVYVVTRSDDRARALAASGYRPIVADVARPQSLLRLPAAETVLFSVGYDRASGVSMHEVFVDGLKATLDALPAETGRFIYTSSTGVYSQSTGEWVDEGSACEPQRDGGRACLAAEQVLMAHRLGERAIVLRLAGLYGPGRVPNADDVRQGRLIAAPQDGYLNLIHVEDAVEAVIAAELRATPPRTYVVSDGHPVVRREYYEQLARLLHAVPPRFVAPRADLPAARRATSDKRACNARMLGELGLTLAHPSYREGLAAILASDSDNSAEDRS